MKGDRFYQSQYILHKCFVNKKNVIRTSLNTSQDYLNAIYDSARDALRINLDGGVLPSVDGADMLPDMAQDNQICPVYNTDTGGIDFYQWDNSLGEWQFRGGTLQDAVATLDGEQRFALEWVSGNMEELKGLVNHDYTVNTEEITLDPNSTIINVQGNLQNIDDDLDGDSDETTPYRIDIVGYVISVATYADNNAESADRYYTHVTYDSSPDSIGVSHIYMDQQEYEYYAGLSNGKNVIVVYYMSNAMSSPVRKTRYILHQDHTATDEDGTDFLAEAVSDGSSTSYKLEVAGYVLGVEAYESNESNVLDKYYTKITYEPDGVNSGHSAVYFDSEEYDGIAAMTNSHNVIDIYTVARIFPASVKISESQLLLPYANSTYVVINQYGNVIDISDDPDKDGDPSTHIRIPVKGYVLDLEGYYSDADENRSRLITKMSYSIDTDMTDVYLDREYYETVSTLHNGKNILYVYAVGPGTCADMNQLIPNGGIEYVSTYPVSPISDRLYVTSTGARLYHGSSYVDFTPSSALTEVVRGVLPNVTVIPASTTAYSLLDATATTNNHSWHYRHAPTTAPTYTLPDVTNTTVEHCIVLDIDFTSVQTCAFEDVNGNSITPMDTLNISSGDIVEYLMKYDYLQSKWLISACFLKDTSNA